MATTQATPQATKIVSKSVFDLKSFSDINIGLEYNESPAPATLKEALAFFGNDESVVLKALVDAIRAKEEKEALARPLSEFRTFAVNSEGEELEILNGPADIVPVNEKLVQDLVLNIAKQHFGFSKDATREAKSKAKVDAKAFIGKSEALKGYLTLMSSSELPAGSETAKA